MQEDNPESSITVSDIDTAPDSISSGSSDKGDSADIIELVGRLGQLASENVDLKDENKELKRTARTIEILDDLIEPYAKKAYIFMCFYAAAVAIMLILHGFALFGFHLEETVLSFLVGSTAATVIGLVGMVLTGIFVGARRNHN